CVGRCLDRERLIRSSRYRYRSRTGIDRVHDATGAATLPFLHLLLLTGSDVALLHHDHRGSFEGIVLAGLAANQRAVAYLYILKMNRRGVLQILLSGLGLHDSSCIGHGYGSLGARIGL